MSPTGDRCGDLIFGAVFGAGCAIGGALTSTGPLFFGGLVILGLCITGLVAEPARRNRSASVDLSSLNREDERIAWEHERIRRVG